MVKDNRKHDPTKSALWRTFDALLLRQLLPDIETISELGDIEHFGYVLDKEVPESWLDTAELPYRILHRDPLEDAVSQLRLRLDNEAFSMVFLWRLNRRRTLAKAALIREEAERLRSVQAKRPAAPKGAA